MELIPSCGSQDFKSEGQDQSHQLRRGRLPRLVTDGGLRPTFSVKCHYNNDGK